jgi:phosphomannomutase
MGLDLVRDGYEVPFGYEEAIGFMFGNEIRDKDGVAATVCLAIIYQTTAPYNYFVLVGLLRRTRRICEIQRP